MKKIIALIFLLTLTSCAENVKEELAVLDYDTFAQQHEQWKNILEIDSIDYLVYIYHPDCYYCEKIKNEILSYASHPFIPLYFCLFSSEEVPVSSNSEKTIGATDISLIYISGTPTILHFSDKILTSNISGSSGVVQYLEHISLINISKEG